MTLALLAVTQMLSPAFPTGAFAYSHGLETVIAQGVVQDSDSLRGWLEQVLSRGAGWQDAVLLAQGLAGADLEDLDALARALAPSAERCQETLDQGTALARTVAGMTGTDHPARALPVALAAAARDLGAPAEQVVALYLQGFASNLVTIGIRHVPLGQTQGQQVLRALAPMIADLAMRATQASLDDLASAALAADLAAMTHETQVTRIFRT